jgi:2-keto-myo-inositol isomerase
MARFKLCLNTSTIRPTSIQDKIRVAGAAGYEAIELWIDDLTGYQAAGGTLSEIRDLVEDAGLEVPTVVHLSGWMDVPDSDFEHNLLAEARRMMEQGVEVGASRIIAGPARGQADLDRAADRYNKLMELGKEVGCLPTLEFLGFVEHVNNVDTLLEIVHKANNPDTTVVMDSFHIYRGGGSNGDILKVPGNQVSIFHINDAPRTEEPEILTDGDRVQPGDGILDLPDMLNKLEAQGFSGCVSLELFNAKLWIEDPFEIAKAGAEKVKKLIA